MLGADPELAFDRWYAASEDASNIEAVLLLDASHSMLPWISEVCGAAWAIKRAVDSVGGRVTVLSYAESARLVYGADARAEAGAIRCERAYAMNAAGVPTALCVLGDLVSFDAHHHEHSTRLVDASALVDLARRLVRTAAARQTQ